MPSSLSSGTRIQPSNAAPDAALLGEAADWLIRRQSAALSVDEQQAFERWCARSPAHAAAWARAEMVMQTFGGLPADIGRGALQKLGRQDRRAALNRLALLLLVAPAAWLVYRQMPWAEWSADVRTATGEQKQMTLADGSQLTLNTASAVAIAFTATERRLQLRAGEIMISTARDPSPQYRPFVVETPQGTVKALGTRFSVRLLEGDTLVAVLQDAVEVSPLHALNAVPVRVSAGEQASFDAQGVRLPLQRASASAALWQLGMLAAENMRLSDLLAELGRYRRGLLRCAPALADLRVSGAFSLRDTDASLALLQSTLPVRVHYRTRYWVSVESA